MNKLEIYLKFAQFYTKFAQPPNQKKGNINKLGLELQALGLALMIVGSDDVAKKYLAWRAIAMEGSKEDAEKRVNAYAEIMLAMRQDLFTATELELNDILDSML